MKDRFEEALDLSEEILESIELEKIKLTSVVLRCLRLARLINDYDAVTWLQYESTGYPRNSQGYIENKAFEIAYQKDVINRQKIKMIKIDIFSQKQFRN